MKTGPHTHLGSHVIMLNFVAHLDGTCLVRATSCINNSLSPFAQLHIPSCLHVFLVLAQDRKLLQKLDVLSRSIHLQNMARNMGGDAEICSVGCTRDVVGNFGEADCGSKFKHVRC